MKGIVFSVFREKSIVFHFREIGIYLNLFVFNYSRKNILPSNWSDSFLPFQAVYCPNIKNIPFVANNDPD